jgi:hypothetical protein
VAPQQSSSSGIAGLTGSGNVSLQFPGLDQWHPTDSAFWNLALFLVLIAGIVAIWRSLT